MTREIVIGVAVAVVVALLAFLGGILSQGALVNALGGVVNKEVGGEGVVERLAALQNKVAEIEARPSGDVTDLEARVATLEARGWVFRGAVVAFDRAEGCPDESWVNFAPAIGRAIIGAGNPSSNTEEPLQVDEEGRRLSSRKYREHAGEEVHQLKEAEMPRHSHIAGVGVLENRAIEAFGAGGAAPYWATGNNGGVYPLTSLAGSDTPHNNMPPFIALYFCKYEGRQ